MVADGNKVTPLRKPQPCPECGKPSTRENYPFCSERCRELDLNRWFNGTYTIPVSETGENVEDDPDDRG
jgi:uncharacterized protein